MVDSSGAPRTGRPIRSAGACQHAAAHPLQVRRQLALPGSEQRQQRGGQVALQVLPRRTRARRYRPPSAPYGTNSSDLIFSLRAPATLSACSLAHIAENALYDKLIRNKLRWQRELRTKTQHLRWARLPCTWPMQAWRSGQPQALVAVDSMCMRPGVPVTIIVDAGSL